MEYRFKTTLEDYKVEYDEHVRMLNMWKDGKSGRDYEIVELEDYAFKIIATENGEN